ncbi:hypothetical protein A0J48_018135 [Sphaerospermopsis aphanizomenoides BCCUSP55]|uniref:hypothetical protein n=1 Tax=Sphaerospermopsis aphanizomenoides TaxID=459663 RepID=UPI0019048967|nr:hypothetical protein [Sphaerospermopsis aphanizomenoides]MBK1989430.1 hypothetical protein [Sphaerospermopsis aphanizomenoides BCCUSP55]
MPSDPQTVSQKRQQMLQHLRERRQESRHGLSQKGGQSNEGMPLEHFVKLADPAESEAVATTPDTLKNDHENQLVKIRERLKQARSLRKSLKSQPSEQENGSVTLESLSSGKSAFSERKELLEDLISDHFRNNLKSWITSVDPDLGVSSTSLVELEEHQQEIEYRYKILKLLLDITQQELNKIEIHIRASKSLENN